MRNAALVFFLIVPLVLFAVPVLSANDQQALWDAYRHSFKQVQFESDIARNGFEVVPNQAFELEHAALGRLRIIPAINKAYRRLALFGVREDGSVAMKTDDFISNSWFKGQTRQINRNVLSISFGDLNGDNLDDIMVICACQNDSGLYVGKTYQVADVLFQNQAGFYRDPRVSDKLNRFDMNKTDQAVIAFVRDGISTEFLFTAPTLDTLLAKGFQPITLQRFTEHFEKFGVVEVVPGFFDMAGQNYLMLYLIDQKGSILWNFQPMHDYVNFYAIDAISFRDIDGDGNKDLTLIARYVTYNPSGIAVIKKDYNIYYQRAGYFLEDTRFKQTYAGRETDNLDVIDNKARQYWGWPQ